MKKNLTILMLSIIGCFNSIYAQNLSIEETLNYIADNSSTYFKVDSEGFIYNDRYKFHASEVGVTTHMSSAVRVICTAPELPNPFGGTTIYSVPKCIKCLKRDCYEGTYGGQPSSSDFYINVDSSYDQNRLMNAINHLIKKVKEKYPKRGGNDPFAN